MKFPSFCKFKKGFMVLVLVVGFLFVFQYLFIGEKTFQVSNVHQNKNFNIVSEITPYQKFETLADKIPAGESVVVVEGKNGIQYRNQSQVLVVQDVVHQETLIGTGKVGDYVGKLTGYGPDCVGCSKLGNVACRTKNGENHSLISDGIYYQDDEFGSVRIVSAARAAFPCGTIMEIDNGRMDPFLVVVLDQGGSMNQAWTRGLVWIDLAFSSQSDVKSGNISSAQAKFHVKRWGW